MVYDQNQPLHANAEDGWHGVVAPGSRFAPESGRYHLYIGYFCPFAHRANLVRVLKNLDSAIDISVVKAYPKGGKGWSFPGANGPDDTYEGSTPDKLFGSKYLHEVYFRADKDYKGKYSVPLLWDTKEDTAVNNESLELLRWLQTGFNEILPEGSPERNLNLYPDHLRAKIDEVTKWMTSDLNSGVYKAGFARDQAGYENGVIPVFAALNQLEQLIHKNGGPYILGKELTELDILAYVSAIRFDAAYVQHFKCNLGTIRGDYPVIHEWLKNLYWNVKGFRETTNIKHIKENYTKSHTDINPLSITPLGPYPDINSGVNLDFASIQPGVIAHPAVLEHQKALPNV
ncbi:glutathione S-transferase [Annulohypoxylon bovei var. microspora]|nr:glutathione S-transferase [Annulohypoxylon bovei var. microspora]